MNVSRLALQPPDPSVNIRPVRISDASALHRCCWSDKTYAVVYELIGHVQRLAAQRRGLGVVVIDDGEAVRGYGQLTLWPHCGELSDLIVAESHRGRGLGTAMIQYLVQAACQKGLPCVEIAASESNTGALALYRRLGFEDSHTVTVRGSSDREIVRYLCLELPGDT